MRKQEIADFCEYTLQKMQEFDVDFYFKMLRMKGYEVTPRYDKGKNLVGYTIAKNASVFKASEIGRKFMASQLESTWKKFHPKPAQVKEKPSTPTATPSSRLVRPTSQTTTSTKTRVQQTAQPKPVPSFTLFNIDTPIGSKAVEIPNSVKDMFLNEAQVPDGNDTATIENVAHTAMLLFVGYIDAATSMSESCGGVVLHLNQVGAKRMTRTSVPMLVDAYRWHILCTNQNQLNAVSTVKTITHIYD